MQSKKFQVKSQAAQMLSILKEKFRCLYSKLRWFVWRRPKAKIRIRKLGKLHSRSHRERKLSSKKSAHHNNGQSDGNRSVALKPIRLATFNAAMFSLAPAVPRVESSDGFAFEHQEEKCFSFRSPISFTSGFVTGHPKGILKQSPLHSALNSPESITVTNMKKSLKVRINLPENEISLSQIENDGLLENEGLINHRNNAIMRSPVCLPLNMMSNFGYGESFDCIKCSIFEVLSEVDADILALQDVKAVEENDMKPLSDLANALGMKFVFAESWAPEYGNAILSKWPIKRWKVQKIVDDDDFRNVLKATIDVPWAGEVNFNCTQLDHLDESWRMKQINAIIQSTNGSPHILTGGLNSLEESDYSWQRWSDIVRYYERIGKPTPRVEVMKFLKEKGYIDGKDYGGECEPVVMIAKGQSVQGTCKYGTRVDYMLASSDCPYKFVPGSYSVISSKGTSDHHIVKVDVIKPNDSSFSVRRKLKPKGLGCSCARGIC